MGERLEDERRVERVTPLVSKFESIIQGQREEAELPFQEFGFFDIFCHECDSQETDRSSIEQFAEKVFNLGWHILSTQRNQVECPECANPPEDESQWAAQYRKAVA